jgi:Loader and inhibitor of phage G40P
MTENECYQLLAYMKQMWPNYDLPEHEGHLALRVQAFSDTCADIDANLLRRAIVDWATSGKDFAPTAGQLRIAAVDRMNIESGRGALPDADEAVAYLLTLLRRYGSYGEVEALADAQAFSPALEQLIRLRDWTTLCQSIPDPLDSTNRAQLRDDYNAARQRFERAATSNPPLIEGEMRRALGGLFQLPDSGAQIAVHETKVESVDEPF